MKNTAALLAGAALLMTLNSEHALAYTMDYSPGRYAASFWLDTAALDTASKGTAEFLQETLNNSFGLWRASVKSHKKHSFFDRDTHVKSSTGYTESASDDSQAAPSTDLEGNLPDLTPFDASEIKSSEYAFETGRIEEGGSAAPVPEPGTIVLLGAGLLGMAIYGKRRMSKTNFNASSLGQ